MTQLETEFVIIGGGLAGFVAALEIAEAGGEAILIEKRDETGGSTAMSGGCFAFAGTDLQRAHGVEDSAELLFRDLREVGGNENDEALVRLYVDRQMETYAWLLAHGAEFSPTIEASSGQSVPRVHTTDPADLVRRLAARCKASGRVRVLMGTAASRLLRDPATGRVEAVLAGQGEATLLLRASRAVLLCSGGFSQDAALIHRFVPQCEAALLSGGPGNVGDGLRMGWQLGADLRDMAYIKGTFGKHPTDETNHHSCVAVYKGAIAVNQDGQRFVDESISYKLLGDACLRQAYASAFQILDQDIFESGDNRVRILDFERRLEDGLMLQADSLEELAGMIEIPAEVLVATVARYNGYVDAGHDPEFGRRHLVHNHGALVRIERTPFYAYPSTTVIFGTYCGLRVDTAMRVIDVFDTPIDGLFAAGEVVGGFHGGAYMTGSALGKAAIFARVAAASALAHVAAASAFTRGTTLG